MENYSEKFLHVFSLSKRFSILIFLFFPVGIVLGLFLQIEWLYLLGPIFIFISALVPGILIILQKPWLAQAWLRGINPYWFPETPWEELSKRKRGVIYFFSISLFVGVVTVVISVIQHIYCT